MDESTTKIDSYNTVRVSQKRFENCLLPLHIIGESTEQEIRDFLQIPINEINPRFCECMGMGLIAISGFNPTKTNLKTGKQNNNYLLTLLGKDEVNKGIWKFSSGSKNTIKKIADQFI